MGSAGPGYPLPWSVYRWLGGEHAATAEIADLTQFATDLAQFLAALYEVDARDGPAAGYDTCFFGVPLAHWNAQTRQALAALQDDVDTKLATQVCEEALAVTWDGPAVWFHGDGSPGNLLADRGRRSGAIDFGLPGGGHPACGPAIPWTILAGESRRVSTAVPP